MPRLDPVYNPFPFREADKNKGSHEKKEKQASTKIIQPDPSLGVEMYWPENSFPFGVNVMTARAEIFVDTFGAMGGVLIVAVDAHLHVKFLPEITFAMSRYLP